MVTDKEIEVPVVKLQQRGLLLYQGKLKARELLETWDIKHFKEEYLKPRMKGPGYQRQEDKIRAEQIHKYVAECQIPLVPSILVAVKDPEFKPLDHDHGILTIPRKEGAVFVIDGQHRGLGFASIRDAIEVERRLSSTARGKEKASLDVKISRLEKLLNFELPTTFVDSRIASKIATEKIDTSKMEKTDKRTLNEDDVERVLFFVINKTQKSINPSLKDALMYLIHSGGIRGIPIIAKEIWRIDAVPLVRNLHYNLNSPLRGCISIMGRKGALEPVKLNTFVSSLKPLIINNTRFGELDKNQQTEYLQEYWTVLKELYPKAFDNAKEYLLLRSLSVYALNRLASDVFDWCQTNGVKVPTRGGIRKYLNPLKDFDWSRNGYLLGLGGQKGAIRAYGILLDELIRKGVKEAKNSLDRLGLIIRPEPKGGIKG